MSVRGRVEEQERDLGAALLRGLLSLACGAAAAALGVLQGAAPLDVALWAVLVPILVGAVLELAPWAWRHARTTRHHRAQVVVPDAAAATPDPAVQARAAAVVQAREAVFAARACGAALDEMLALARVLHEAELDLARATASCGGQVSQALRDELLLRDRPTSVPTTYG